MERQLTHAPHGHILTNAGVWSHDGEWIVYDVRSDAAGAAFDGTRIERVHIHTGEVQVLFESRHGACCGVATCSPVDDRVAFILGPEHPTPDWQYSAYHRRGVIVDAARPGIAKNLDARDLTPPFTPGALRGGSHVHQFSGDGQCVSFTYEDHVLAQNPPPLKGREQPSTLAGGERAQGGSLTFDLNQRNVAVAIPRAVHVPRSHARNHDGEFFSAVVTETTNSPRPGSDEISRAYEEAWIGVPRPRSLAFLGDQIAADGRPLTELFVVDLPDDLTQPGEHPLEGTPTRRPAPPAGTRQRRLTFTAGRKHAGIQGPRHWPRSSPEGSQIAFLMRDDAGTVQIWTISPAGGAPRQITCDPWDVASAFTWDASGERIAYVADGSTQTVDVDSGRTRRITPRSESSAMPLPEACVFSPDGSKIAFVRHCLTGGEGFNQVFVVDAQ